MSYFVTSNHAGGNGNDRRLHTDDDCFHLRVQARTARSTTTYELKNLAVCKRCSGEMTNNTPGGDHYQSLVNAAKENAGESDA